MLANLDIPAINELLWKTDVNEVASRLVSIITNALDIVAPFRKIQTRNNYAAHLSEETKLLMKKRDSLKATMNISKNDEDEDDDDDDDGDDDDDDDDDDDLKFVRHEEVGHRPPQLVIDLHCDHEELPKNCWAHLIFCNMK